MSLYLSSELVMTMKIFFLWMYCEFCHFPSQEMTVLLAWTSNGPQTRILKSMSQLEYDVVPEQLDVHSFRMYHCIVRDGWSGKVSFWGVAVDAAAPVDQSDDDLADARCLPHFLLRHEDVIFVRSRYK